MLCASDDCSRLRPEVVTNSLSIVHALTAKLFSRDALESVIFETMLEIDESAMGMSIPL